MVTGVRAGEPAVLLSLRETEEQLRLFTEPFAIGAEFLAALASGALTLLEAPSIEVTPDVIADRLLNVLDATKVTRLVLIA